jgi:hypothetical protein
LVTEVPLLVPPDRLDLLDRGDDRREEDWNEEPEALVDDVPDVLEVAEVLRPDDLEVDVEREEADDEEEREDLVLSEPDPEEVYDEDEPVDVEEEDDREEELPAS